MSVLCLPAQYFMYIGIFVFLMQGFRLFQRSATIESEVPLFVFQLLFLIFFIILLNSLCNTGFSSLSWILFVFGAMFAIINMIAPTTFQLNLQNVTPTSSSSSSSSSASQPSNSLTKKASVPIITKVGESVKKSIKAVADLIIPEPGPPIVEKKESIKKAESLRALAEKKESLREQQQQGSPTTFWKGITNWWNNEGNLSINTRNKLREIRDKQREIQEEQKMKQRQRVLDERLKVREEAHQQRLDSLRRKIAKEEQDFNEKKSRLKTYEMFDEGDRLF